MESSSPSVWRDTRLTFRTDPEAHSLADTPQPSVRELQFDGPRGHRHTPASPLHIPTDPEIDNALRAAERLARLQRDQAELPRRDKPAPDKQLLRDLEADAHARGYDDGLRGGFLLGFIAGGTAATAICCGTYLLAHSVGLL